jgi:hypothetical protein
VPKVLRLIVIPLVICLLAQAIPAQVVLAQDGGAEVEPESKKKESGKDDGIPQGAKAFNESGTLASDISQNALLLRNDNGTWLVRLQNDTKTDIEGTAESSYLRPGMTVRFSGKLDKKFNVELPIKELVIFPTPQSKGGLGIFVGSGTKPVRKPESNKKYEIRGKVTQFKGGQIVVTAAGKKIWAELGKDVKIKYISHDLDEAKKGDGVKVSGWYYEQPVIGQRQINAVATSVSITLSKPLAASNEKKSKKQQSADE